jgi:hypothetical protein
VNPACLERQCPHPDDTPVADGPLHDVTVATKKVEKRWPGAVCPDEADDCASCLLEDDEPPVLCDATGCVLAPGAYGVLRVEPGASLRFPRSAP